MKRIIVSLLLLFGFGYGVFSQNFPFSLSDTLVYPLRPQIVGQGGSSTATASGFDSLFTNPAGFARKGGSVTLLSPTFWIYGRPDLLLEDLALITGSESKVDSITQMVRRQTEDSFTEDGRRVPGGGVGFGASAGIGLVTRGIGFGVVLTVDSFLSGSPFPLGIGGLLRGNVSIIGGLALPFKVLGIDCYAGGDIRYYMQSLSPLTLDAAVALLSFSGNMSEILEIVPSWNGYGLGLDFGVIAETGPFSFGLSIRDLLGTTVNYTENTISAVLDSVATTGSLPAGGKTVPVSVPESEVNGIRFGIMNVGIAYHPNLGGSSFFFDPTIHAEVSDITGAVNPDASFLTRFHIGASVRTLKLFNVMAGLNQGYVTLGLGMKILVIDINAAIFTRELGNTVGSKPSSGIVVEAAIRF